MISTISFRFYFITASFCGYLFIDLTFAITNSTSLSPTGKPEKFPFGQLAKLEFQEGTTLGLVSF